MAEATGTGLEADIVTGLVAPAVQEDIDLLHRTIANRPAPRDFDRLLALGFDEHRPRVRGLARER